MKFKGLSQYRVQLLGHQHLETFVGGDLLLRVFVIWREPSRMNRADLLSRRIELLRGIDPVSLFIEVILEKQNFAETGGSNFVCSSVY